MINVKLDKTGGLTEALLLTERARESGFKLLIGCMVMHFVRNRSRSPARQRDRLCGPRWAITPRRRS